MSLRVVVCVCASQIEDVNLTLWDLILNKNSAFFSIVNLQIFSTEKGNKTKIAKVYCFEL